MKIKILEKICKVLTLLFIFLTPIIFVPFFTDPYDFGRQIFVLAAAFLIFCLMCLRAIFEKKLSFRKSPYFWPVAVLFVAFTASTLINAPNKAVSFEAIIGPVALLLMTLVLIISANADERKPALYALMAGGTLVSVISLVLFLGNISFPLNFPSLNLSVTKAWSPTGSLVSQAVLLLALVPIGFALIYEAVQKKSMVIGTLTFLANTLILAGLGAAVYLLTNEAKPILLPQLTAWAVAVEGLKNVRYALFGVSPGQFVNAFTAFKPLSLNNTELWNLRFAVSSNWYFQLMTEAGVIGLVLYISLAVKIVKNAIITLREKQINALNLGLYASLVLMIVVQFFVPVNFSLLASFAIILGLIESSEEKKIFDFAPIGNMIIVFLAIPLVIWGVLLFFAGKVAFANSYFLSSAKAAAQNDGIKTYNMQIKAINANSSSVIYHIAYSQTNLALANSLATKTDLTDNDRNTISQLVQQSLREAKSAVSLDPGNANSWENLSGIYRSLINFAEGADQWTISSYQEAIKVDPLNPRLRIDLGGVYYSLKNYNQAATYFLQATNLKPDYANAHYNLANALRELGALADAKTEYEATQTLIKADSADYQKVTAELEDVKKRLPVTPTPKPAAPETLSTPQAPSAGIKPPLELPNEGPPVSPEGANPTP